MTESPHHGTSGEQPDVTATGATGAGGDAAGTPPRGGSGDSAHGARHHAYYEGGAGASSEPGGEDEFDHTANDSGQTGESGESGESSETEGVALAEEDTMAATLLADLQRLQAEYVNYKKRVDRDREVIRHTAVGSVVESLLPVLDDIHMARQAGDLAGGPFAAIADKARGDPRSLRRRARRRGRPGVRPQRARGPHARRGRACPRARRARPSSRCCSPATASVTGSSVPRGSRLPTPPETSAAGLRTQPGGIPDDGSSVRVTVNEEVRHG